ncbi:hypothetical protein CEN40_10490 [Fischerella thermalis CCMEE 5205]|uniref:Uncharacterized protein n=1 Tax=Fischerella thermalis CCMEE 5318 TaxID=2019666 RepID=A0A2N6LGB6_9CYAN|nr:hypothetical protein [Fischerella thermalis]PMB00196.1 hypothetical protein CI592_19035 [Fischerella thermalis CCMEE 5328]PMB18948.1 hypothetical protein CEN47_23795 [Fischerella thermalis CCMEE 5319]PMB22847.1 hypothetical protein CEN46_11565 [Fischerella thermalis CCMEE 5318]PMB46302.1 hypothetical protein CEN40_10490 [Fischerella thermalis CCMEE 5205]
MTKPDFSQMTKQELRAYVLANRDDLEAFYAYVDRMKQQPGVIVTSMEQLEQLIRERENNQTSRTD